MQQIICSFFRFLTGISFLEVFQFEFYRRVSAISSIVGGGGGIGRKMWTVLQQEFMPVVEKWQEYLVLWIIPNCLGAIYGKHANKMPS